MTLMGRVAGGGYLPFFSYIVPYNIFLLFVASWDELKFAKLEIDLLHICEENPRNFGAIVKVSNTQ